MPLIQPVSQFGSLSINAFKALALRQIFQRMLLQRLCAFRIQRVVPVVVLVQDRAEHVLCPVAEENASRLGVHIGFHAVIALQHSFHHGVRAGRFRVQLDQLGAHFVCRAHRAFIEHPSAAADAFFCQTAAKAAQLRLPGFQFAVSLQPCQIQCLPAAVLCQHIVRVHSKAAHALRQLHGLVKSGHIFHLPQPVQAAGCSCIPFGISDLCRHVPADGLACAVRYFPAGQLLLHLPLFRGQALLCQAIGLPHPAGLCRFPAFHTFPGVLHDSLLHRRAFSLYLLYCPITGIGLRFVQSLSFGESHCSFVRYNRSKLYRIHGSDL